ncbi:MAG: dicarboxylate/amino acid:cation symporter [Flavobacteriales bacterium]|nr:dicarboxylate/amino acid:cation symporter [Flavobacteriales bacterium]
MKKLALHWQVIIGLILGTIYAWCSIQFGFNEFTTYYVKPFGDMFINILKLVAVPLVLFSIISGVASLKDIKKLGSLGLKTLVTYVVTTMIAVIVGLTLVNVIKPGTHQSEEVRMRNRIAYEIWRDDNQIEKVDELCLSCDPANAALVAEIRNTPHDDSAENEWVKDKIAKAEAEKKTQKEVGPLKALIDVVPTNIFKALADSTMLQVIFFAVFFGIVLVSLPKEKRDPVFNLVDGLNEVFVRMIMVVMKAMPVFVFALMAGQIVKAAGTDPARFFELLDFLGVYSVTVVIGLLFMIFIFYPTLVSLLVRKIKYMFFMRGMRDAQITAFSTSSSVATLPVTMDCVKNKIGVSESTTSFVLPIGATVNMDGTSLYQAVAVVALAQFHMVDLSISQQLVIILTATIASIGAAAIPSAGLVLMIIVLESVGMNPMWIGIIFPIDRILDMCRTVVNVTGDGAVSSIIANSQGEFDDQPTAT